MASSNAESSCSSDSDQGEWLDLEPDYESAEFISLFDSRSFATLADMLLDCKQRHAFDLVAHIRRLRLDFMGAVKLVNLVRRRVQSGDAVAPDEISLADLESDELLKPVLENDAVLFSLEDVVNLDEVLVQKQAQDQQQPRLDGGDDFDALYARHCQLQAQTEALRAKFADYRLSVEKTLESRWGDDPVSTNSGQEKKSQDPSYFESYAGNDIHETMLKDHVRTGAYRDFIYGNKHLFKDKVVLDIGCGTGILSMFCAKAGASMVIAVDKSDIIDKARQNIFHNRMSNTITCLRGAIEDVKLPVDKVDVIVSEWMGYCLLYEAMLPSVLFARDKYLKPDGLLVPSFATLSVAPMHDDEYIADTITFWRDVYGFDMEPMQQGIYDDVRVQQMPPDSICGQACVFKTLDLRHVQPQDLIFTATWESCLERSVDQIHGFVIWFDCFFTPDLDLPPASLLKPAEWAGQKPGRVVMTTSPYATETHWKQGLLLLKAQSGDIPAPKSSGIVGQMTLSVPETSARALDIEASWSVAGCERRQLWKLR